MSSLLAQQPTSIGATGSRRGRAGSLKVYPSMSQRTQPGDQTSSPHNPADQGRFILWVDGVGAYLLCLGERVSIGGPEADGERADVSLLANLSRRHAAFVRAGEGYLLEAHGQTLVSGRPVDRQTLLADGYQITLAGSVRLRFRLPSVLSSSAVIDLESGHRPVHSVDGIILMDETCLLGPGRENHVVCPDWDKTVLLFRRDDAFWCKAPGDVFLDERPTAAGGPFQPGQVVSGLDFRFRIEALTT